MDPKPYARLMTRRDLFRATTAIVGGTVAARLFAGPFSSTLLALQQAAATDPLTVQRAAMGAAPIETIKLGGNLVMFSGPGGNVVVLNGTDGKVVVDTFVLPAWTKLKQTLDGMGSQPISRVINTHWHFDHADNNESFRKAGATIVGHENTAKRLSESHDLLGMKFSPAPPAARPTQTFKDMQTFQANGESIEMAYIPPAHTDTDISIRFAKANVLHLGDVFFNGIYPFIDASTGGTINGMIRGADRGLKLADKSTKIVPGHGPLADVAALTKYRDVLVTVRDRVQKLKTAGRSLQDVQAAKPNADLDATWGKGFMQPNDFLALVYNTL